MSQRVTRSQIRSALARVALFASLTPEQRRDLAAASRILELHAGDRLWRVGDDAVSMGMVLAGRLKVTQQAGDREVIVDVAVPGDVLGAVAFALGAGYQSEVVCLRRARVVLVPAAMVRVFLEKDPRATAALAFDLAAQVRRLMRLVEDLSSGNVERRLARVLVSLARRVGVPFPGGMLMPLRLRRADLASLAATTLESVSRKVSSWRKRGWVVPQPVGYLIRDLPALKRIADEE